jgi:hypothetical protein
LKNNVNVPSKSNKLKTDENRKDYILGGLLDQDPLVRGTDPDPDPSFIE